jgi:hypothetical protein
VGWRCVIVTLNACSSCEAKAPCIVDLTLDEGEWAVSLCFGHVIIPCGNVSSMFDQRICVVSHLVAAYSRHLLAQAQLEGRHYGRSLRKGGTAWRSCLSRKQFWDVTSCLGPDVWCRARYRISAILILYPSLYAFSVLRLQLWKIKRCMYSITIIFTTPPPLLLRVWQTFENVTLRYWPVCMLETVVICTGQQKRSLQ